MSTRVGEATATSDGRSGETTANANVRQSSRIAQARKRQFGQDVTNTVGAAPRQVKAPRKATASSTAQAQAQAQASSSTQAASAASQGARFNQRRHAKFATGLKPVSAAETTPAFTLETLRATLTSAFSPTSAETSLQAAMLRAALTTAKEVRLEQVNVNWPVASGLAIPRAASGILVLLQWPRRDNVLVRGVSVEELERADQPRCHDGDWLTPMRFRVEERDELCVTGHVLSALVTSLLGSDVSASASASGGDGPAAPIRWCDICDFSLDDTQPKYTGGRLTTPKLFARAARNGADALSLSLARGEVRSSLVFVFGGVAAKQTKTAILKRARQGFCYVWEVSEASLAAYQLAKDSIVVSNASAIWFVQGVNGGKTYVVVFGPALQELRPGSRAEWKHIGTGIITTVHLLLDLARRCHWSPEAAAEAAKGMRRALGSICGKRAKELGVGIHEQVDGVYVHAARGGENARDLGVGVHEQVDGVYVHAARGGENARDLGVGIHEQVDGVYVHAARGGELGGKRAKELGVGAHERVDGVYVNRVCGGKLRRPLVDSVNANKHTLNKLDKGGPDALTQAELKQLEAKVTSELIAWKRILERKLTPRKFTAETAREFVKVAADAADEFRTTPNLKGTHVLPFIAKKLRSKYSVPLSSLSQGNICYALGCFNKYKHFLHVLDE